MSDLTQIGRAFVIRPFGTKENKKGDQLDFDKIHNELIEPALREFGLSGGTTAEFVKQGSIHEDMFREIISADLVIADISIHNANAFYELGIRHALRNRHTVMIRTDRFTDEHVFDLKPERYFEYSAETPANSINALIQTIKDTVENDAGDSPVFRLLPGLTSLDPAKVIVLPNSFQEKLEQARASGSADQLLALKKEVYGQPWEREGIRHIARAQSDQANHIHAKDSWEEMRTYDAKDTEANQRLATHYQKLKQFTESKQAAQRTLLRANISKRDKAETLALIASNHKTQWRQGFENIADLADRQKTALQSELLEQASNCYQQAFEHHRNHYYSGLNAVAMLATQTALAKIHPQEWEDLMGNEAEAKYQLKRRVKLLKKLKTGTQLAIEPEIGKNGDEWAKISLADLTLLSTQQTRKVEGRYSNCINTIQGFRQESLRNQLALYKTLGLFKDNVQCALKVLDSAQE